jgi:hypothetical protein
LTAATTGATVSHLGWCCGSSGVTGFGFCPGLILGMKYAEDIKKCTQGPSGKASRDGRLWPVWLLAAWIVDLAHGALLGQRGPPLGKVQITTDLWPRQTRPSEGGGSVAI